jgi:hypothetical protein
MELKNVNPNGDDVVTSNLTTYTFFLGNCKNWFKNKHHMLFFLQDAVIAH